MKNILLLSLLCFIYEKTFCQDMRDRGFLSFTVGHSKVIVKDTPNNLYTSARKFDGKPVGLKNGFVKSGTFGYNVMSNLGLAVSLQRIGLNVDEDSTLFRGWVIESAVAGPYLTFNMDENVFFDFRFLLGYMRITTPVYGKNALLVTRILDTQIRDAEGMEYQIAMASRIPVNTKISLVFSIDYFSANPAWQIGDDKITESISALNFNFGFAGRLWKMKK